MGNIEKGFSGGNIFESPDKSYEPNHEHSAERCIFCEIIRGESEASIILRDDEKKVISFMDLQGYPLVCPTEHIEGTPEAIEQNQDIIKEMFGTALQLLSPVYESYQNEGLNIVTNIGTAAGMEIPHLHIHLIPRSVEDRAVRLTRRASQSREELDSRAQELRTILSRQNK